MTVKEFVEELQKLDQDKEIIISNIYELCDEDSMPEIEFEKNKYILYA